MLNERSGSVKFVVKTSQNSTDAVDQALGAVPGTATRIVEIQTHITWFDSTHTAVTCFVFYSTDIQIPLLTSNKENKNG